MKEKSLGLAIGVILAAVTITIASMLPKVIALQFLMVLLMGIASVYIGFTFSNVGRKQDIVIEMANIEIAGTPERLFGEERVTFLLLPLAARKEK